MYLAIFLFVHLYQESANSLPGMTPKDVFQLEYVSAPSISPSGTQVVYQRHFMDPDLDRRNSDLWLLDLESGKPHPVSVAEGGANGAVWSPDGTRIAYIGMASGSAQIHIYWVEQGRTIQISKLGYTPRGLHWSADGTNLYYAAQVNIDPWFQIQFPKPSGKAYWASEPRVVTKSHFRRDGQGYLASGFSHWFRIPAEGGTPIQLTGTPLHRATSAAWSKDGAKAYYSAQSETRAFKQPVNTEIFELDLITGTEASITDRDGPDEEPAISPDGRFLAYVGFDDRRLGYQSYSLYIRDLSSGKTKVFGESLDRRLSKLKWAPDSSGVYVTYADHGRGKIAFCNMSGKFTELVDDLGGTTLGRPYMSGDYDVGPEGLLVYTATQTDRPADLQLRTRDGKSRQLTFHNEDFFASRAVSEVRPLQVPSSVDGLNIDAWEVLPPGFDAGKRYPLILEIHGGPYADYGPRFSAEMQLYAAAGYVVVYANPRGSTSYGSQFANHIEDDYPGKDAEDLLSVVAAMEKKAYIDGKRLYITGGSGGGTLTAWITTMDHRFKAAVVAKPVINWTSFLLTADAYGLFSRRWFSNASWEDPESYLKRSPISFVHKVKTPSMVIVGGQDFRTPPSEAEQWFAALQRLDVPSVLVYLPDSGHDMTVRPSYMAAKVTAVLSWFNHYDAAAGGKTR